MFYYLVMNREVLGANPSKGMRAATLLLETKIEGDGRVAAKYPFTKTKNVHDDNSYGISWGSGTTYACEISQSTFSTLLERSILTGTSSNHSTNSRFKK